MVSDANQAAALVLAAICPGTWKVDPFFAPFLPPDCELADSSIRGTGAESSEWASALDSPTKSGTVEPVALASASSVSMAVSRTPRCPPRVQAGPVRRVVSFQAAAFKVILELPLDVARKRRTAGCQLGQESRKVCFEKLGKKG